MKDHYTPQGHTKPAPGPYIPGTRIPMNPMGRVEAWLKRIADTIANVFNTKQDKNIGAENAGKTLIADENGDLQPGEVESLPDVTSEDDGKFLGVVNGEWNKTDIDLSQYATTQYVDDKTGEISDDIDGIETIVGGHTTAISDLNREKVNSSFPVADAGKALVVGGDGAVTPQNIAAGEVVIDTMLNTSGAAADSKAVGDAIAAVRAVLG